MTEPFSGLSLESIWRRKWLLAGTAAATLGLGTVYLLVTTPIYEADSRIYVKWQDEVPLNAGREHREDRNFVATQAEIIASPLILRPALEAAPVALPERSDKDLMTFVMESLTVSPVVNTDVISVRYRSRDPQEATRFLAAVIRAYEQHLQRTESHTSTEVLGLLTRREEELRDQLRLLEQQFVEQRRQSNAVGIGDEQVEVHSASLAKTAQRLAEVQTSRVDLEATLQVLRDACAASGLPFPQTVDRNQGDGAPTPFRPQTPVVTVKKVIQEQTSRTGAERVMGILKSRSDLGLEDVPDIEAALRLAVVRQEQTAGHYGPKHEATGRTAAEVARWGSMLETRVSTALESLSRRLEVEKAVESELTALYARELQDVKSIEDLQLKEQMLDKEIKRVEGVYDAVFARLTDLELMNRALSQGRVSITVRDLDGSDRPAELIWPQPLVLLAACGVLGLLAGLLYVVAAERYLEMRPRTLRAS